MVGGGGYGRTFPTVRAAPKVSETLATPVPPPGRTESTITAIPPTGFKRLGLSTADPVWGHAQRGGVLSRARGAVPTAIDCLPPVDIPTSDPHVRPPPPCRLLRWNHPRRIRRLQWRRLWSPHSQRSPPSPWNPHNRQRGGDGADGLYPLRAASRSTQPQRAIWPRLQPTCPTRRLPQAPLSHHPPRLSRY